MGLQYDISIYGRLRTQIRMLFFYFFYTCVAPLYLYFSSPIIEQGWKQESFLNYLVKGAQNW